MAASSSSSFASRMTHISQGVQIEISKLSRVEVAVPWLDARACQPDDFASLQAAKDFTKCLSLESKAFGCLFARVQYAISERMRGMLQAASEPVSVEGNREFTSPELCSHHFYQSESWKMGSPVLACQS